MASNCEGNKVDTPHATNDAQHSHKCPKCGVIWWHLDGYKSGDLPPPPIIGYDGLHECPKCGTREGWIYEHMSGYLTKNPETRMEDAPTDSERAFDKALEDVAQILVLSSLLDAALGRPPGDTLADVVEGRRPLPPAAVRLAARKRRG